MAKKKMRADCLYERETTIVYNELEADCLVYTCNKKLQRAIERLGVKPESKDHVGRRYKFPKSWLQPPEKPKEKGPGKTPAGRKEVSKRGKKTAGRSNGGKLHSNRKDRNTKGGKTGGKGRIPVHGSKGAGRGQDSVRPKKKTPQTHVHPDRVQHGKLHKEAKGVRPADKKAHLRSAGRH